MSSLILLCKKFAHIAASFVANVGNSSEGAQSERFEPLAMHRFQFRLSTLLWITLAVGCWFGGMRYERWRYALEQERQLDDPSKPLVIHLDLPEGYAGGIGPLVVREVYERRSVSQEPNGADEPQP